MKPQNNDEKLKQICNHADNFFLQMEWMKIQIAAVRLTMY